VVSCWMELVEEETSLAVDEDGGGEASVEEDGREGEEGEEEGEEEGDDEAREEEEEENVALEVKPFTKGLDSKKEGRGRIVGQGRTWRCKAVGLSRGHGEAKAWQAPCSR